MIKKFLKNIPEKHQGLIALVLGVLVLFGALGRLGVLQAFFYSIMIITSVSLLLWGLDKSDALKVIAKRLKK